MAVRQSCLTSKGVSHGRREVPAFSFGLHVFCQDFISPTLDTMGPNRPPRPRMDSMGPERKRPRTPARPFAFCKRFSWVNEQLGKSILSGLEVSTHSVPQEGLRHRHR